MWLRLALEGDKRRRGVGCGFFVRASALAANEKKERETREVEGGESKPTKRKGARRRWKVPVPSSRDRFRRDSTAPAECGVHPGENPARGVAPARIQAEKEREGRSSSSPELSQLAPLASSRSSCFSDEYRRGPETEHGVETSLWPS